MYRLNLNYFGDAKVEYAAALVARNQFIRVSVTLCHHWLPTPSWLILTILPLAPRKFSVSRRIICPSCCTKVSSPCLYIGTHRCVASVSICLRWGHHLLEAHWVGWFWAHRKYDGDVYRSWIRIQYLHICIRCHNTDELARANKPRCRSKIGDSQEGIVGFD